MWNENLYLYIFTGEQIRQGGQLEKLEKWRQESQRNIPTSETEGGKTIVQLCMRDVCFYVAVHSLSHSADG